MEFREIDRSNYWDCISLTVNDSQKWFVADNKRSLVEAAYEDGLYTLGVYHGDTMVGFILYDFDDTIPGWSMSRFMIGKQYQGKGYGKQAVVAFLDYFKKKHNAEKLISACLWITRSCAGCTLILVLKRSKRLRTCFPEDNSGKCRW